MRLPSPRRLRPDVVRRRSRTAVAGVVTALLLAAPGAVAPAAASTESADASLVVATDKGKIEGAYTQTRRSFQGVPFAAPPVGSLRWKPPAPAAPWPGVRPATAPGSPCPQPQTDQPEGAPLTNEDCLYLNVTTPRTITRKLPVMVYIPGGAFVTGSGSMYDPAPLVDRGNVIVVTVNYRLGLFGFLGLPGLSAEGGAHKSGLYGIEDQQAALAWVRRNVSAFGGDAHNVTVFGESAGGASACIQMVSPLATGLFDKVAAESGCNLRMPSLREGEATGASFAKSVGCTSGDVVRCLRGKSSEELMAKLTPDSTLSFWPSYGGAALPDRVDSRFAKGYFPRVPLLQGTNHNEGRFFIAADWFGPVDANNYQPVIQATWGDAAAKAIVDEYPISAYPSPALALATVYGDGTFACQAARASEIIKGRTSLYAYEFNDATAPSLAPPFTDFPLGATHTSELTYLFNFGIPLDASQQASANRLIDYWTNFARTGNPNGPSVPRWPTYSFAGRLQSLETTTARTVSSDSFATEHHCAFWQKVRG